MGRPSRYSPEVRERAVGLVFDHEQRHDSQWAAIRSVAEKIGCSSETLRHWIHQAERDEGRRPRLTTEERQRLTALEREKGGGSDLRGHVVRLCLRGVRHRCLCPAHRRLARLRLAADRLGPRCARAGALRPSDDRPARAPQRSGRAVSLDRYTERLADASLEPSVGSVADSYDNALAESVIGLYQDRTDPASGTVATSRGCGVCHARMGGLVQPPSAARADRPRAAGRVRTAVLSHAGHSSHGGRSHVMSSLGNPGRFNSKSK